MSKYGNESQTFDLPPPEPTPPAIFSVPRLGGGYVYYQSPEGVAPGLGNNWPLPSMKHPNGIGLASIAMGRHLPRGSVRVGEGSEARGSITPLPGAGGAIPGLDASLGSFSDLPVGAVSNLVVAVGAFALGYIVSRERWG
jgi:hypothetical protein